MHSALLLARAQITWNASPAQLENHHPVCGEPAAQRPASPVFAVCNPPPVIYELLSMLSLRCPAGSQEPGAGRAIEHGATGDTARYGQLGWGHPLTARWDADVDVRSTGTPDA